MPPAAPPLPGLDAEDPLIVAGVVRSIGQRLRRGQVEVEEILPLAAHLTLLSADARVRVRQSVAEVAPYLPKSVYDAVIPALTKDRSPHVREAATHAIARRATLERERATVEEHDARVEKWYREIEAGMEGGRALARRIAEHSTEYFVRRMCHEADGARPAYDTTILALRTALDAPALDRALVRTLVERIDERFKHYQHVLATGRAHARAADAQIRAIDLGALLADEVELLPARFPDRAARLAIDASAIERPLPIDGDVGFLREAFSNILKNAVEAYDARPAAPIRIAVSARAGATEATVTIRDEGSGMTDHDVERAFVPFQSSKPGGSGFGLFLARRAATAVHGGALDLESRAGEGTTLTMTLPLRQEGARKKRAKRKVRR